MRRKEIVLTEPANQDAVKLQNSLLEGSTLKGFSQEDPAHAGLRWLRTSSGVLVEQTFAEAFPMSFARLIVTAETERWVDIAALTFTGYGTSVIGCDLEAGIERKLTQEETPDGRPGVALLMFSFSRDQLAKAVVNRVGQCLLTCATTAVFDGWPQGDLQKRIPLGDGLRYFGDGYQMSKQLGDQRYWRIPVMDGEFVCEDSIGTGKGVAGGNLIFGGTTQAQTLLAAEEAVVAARSIPGVILPFPGGIVRSGSKVGSKYAGLRASTNDQFCPTIGAINKDPLLPEGTVAVYEIVIDGIDFDAVERSMKAAFQSLLCAQGLTVISAGNYGGKLGPHHFPISRLGVDGLHSV